VSPLIPGYTSGSSIAHVPTYENVSSPTGVCLVARETVHRDCGICDWNCSTKGAVTVVGCVCQLWLGCCDADQETDLERLLGSCSECEEQGAGSSCVGYVVSPHRNYRFEIVR
jgi:hypothetical protein